MKQLKRVSRRPGRGPGVGQLLFYPPSLSYRVCAPWCGGLPRDQARTGSLSCRDSVTSQKRPQKQIACHQGVGVCVCGGVEPSLDLIQADLQSLGSCFQRPLCWALHPPALAVRFGRDKKSPLDKEVLRLRLSIFHFLSGGVGCVQV